MITLTRVFRPTAALLSLLGALLLPAGEAQAFKCLPLYGNWCGPGHPAYGPLPPVDAYDAACMHHDYCSAAPVPQGACDRALVVELNQLAAQSGYLPRPLQWVEYLLRVKSGGGWGNMPLPMPWDAMGLMSSVASPCW